MDIRQIVIDACRAQRIKDAELARRANVGRINLGKWLRGKNDSTSSGILAAVLNALQLTIVPAGTLAPVLKESTHASIKKLKQKHQRELEQLTALKNSEITALKKKHDEQAAFDKMMYEKALARPTRAALSGMFRRDERHHQP